MGMSKVFERKMSDTLDKLIQAGYVDTFQPEPGGLRATKKNLMHRPDELEIEKIERFEGISNPEDETIVLALRCKTHGCLGTYVGPYGKDMPSVDASQIRKIPDARKK
jgi:hypothetical protein